MIEGIWHGSTDQFGVIRLFVLELSPEAERKTYALPSGWQSILRAVRAPDRTSYTRIWTGHLIYHQFVLNTFTTCAIRLRFPRAR